jgi:DNA-binding NtrC family response regulator
MGSAPKIGQAALIVEDDADQRSFIAMLLQDAGFETIECESAEAALATMLLRGRDVCLVFADLRLSGPMDGVDLASELRMRWPHLSVVLTSGNVGTRLADLPAGVEYMPKPWQPLNLLITADRAKSAGRPARRGGLY